MHDDDVWVVVPAFNEAPVVREVLLGLLEHFPKVVAVDDCSTDGTAHEIASTGARLIRHPVNMGAGGALQTGVDFALLDPATRYVVMFDADGQHRAADAAAMVQHLREGAVDILIGSRFLGGAVGMTRSRRRLLLLARWFERLSTGVRLTDAHNGLRAFTREFAEVLQLQMTDMAWATEFLERAARSGLRIGEFPVTVEYSDYSRGKGQHSLNSINIGVDLLLHRLLRGPN